MRKLIKHSIKKQMNKKFSEAFSKSVAYDYPTSISWWANLYKLINY